MKKHLLLVVLLAISLTASSQYTASQVKFLTDQLASAKTNDEKLSVLKYLSYSNNTRGIKYNIMGEQLSHQLKKYDEEEMFILQLCRNYRECYNFPQQLVTAMHGLTLSKQLNDNDYINTFLLQIGLAYQCGNDKKQAIFYYEQANKSGHMVNNPDICATALNNIAEIYRDSSLITNDSQLANKAVKLFREAIKLGSGIDHDDAAGDAILLLGEMKLAANEADSALWYFRRALTVLPDRDYKNIVLAYKDIANVFLLKHQSGTAYLYMQNGFNIASEAKDLNGEKYLGAMLSSYYENKDDHKSLYYYKRSVVAKDSLKSNDQYKEIQQIKIQEQLKDEKAKKALALLVAKEAQERRERLQYLLIVCCIIAILSLALFFSKTSLNIKYVDYMGVFSLLLLFEFITLFIHPIVQARSNHSPLIELLALVVFASIMGYCHEKSTDWIKEKLEQRHNKRFHLMNTNENDM